MYNYLIWKVTYFPLWEFPSFQSFFFRVVGEFPFYHSLIGQKSFTVVKWSFSIASIGIKRNKLSVQVWQNQKKKKNNMKFLFKINVAYKLFNLLIIYKVHTLHNIMYIDT